MRGGSLGDFAVFTAARYCSWVADVAALAAPHCPGLCKGEWEVPMQAADLGPSWLKEWALAAVGEKEQ